MITKEEREAVKKQLLDLATDRESFFNDTYDDDIFRADYAALIKAVELIDSLNEVETDHDNYKRRAEALERAIYQNCNYCALYLQDKLTDDCWERRNTGIFDFGCKGWQFDEARFSAGGDGE